ncbi:MAG: YidC/Oxa1 family membrane protein insertase [Trueperaceae bacterium]
MSQEPRLQATPADAAEPEVPAPLGPRVLEAAFTPHVLAVFLVFLASIALLVSSAERKAAPAADVDVTPPRPPATIEDVRLVLVDDAGLEWSRVVQVALPERGSARRAPTTAAMRAILTAVPFIGEHMQYLNVLPILCAVAMIVSTKLMPMSGPIQNPQQKMMMTIMPVFFSVICYSFASGLNLYILTSTVLGIAQNRLIRVSATDVPEKKAPKKRRHWYAAAQARRRQAAKDMKEAKDNGRSRTSKKQKGGKTSKPGRSQ